MLTQMGTWVVYDREIVVNKFIFKDCFIYSFTQNAEDGIHKIFF